MMGVGKQATPPFPYTLRLPLINGRCLFNPTVCVPKLCHYNSPLVLPGGEV